MSWRTIKCDIDSAIVFRIDVCPAALESPCIVGRKNTTDKRDDAEGILSIVTERIDVPPQVASRAYLLVKPRCTMVVSAANCPERAAIGTPGPGWTLPPAR